MRAKPHFTVSSWYLNEYIKNDELVFKIVSWPTRYENWEKVDTYVLKKGKFISYETYRKNLKISNKQPLFKKLLEFFNKL